MVRLCCSAFVSLPAKLTRPLPLPSPPRLEANPGPPQAKDKREPKYRPRGVPKPVFIPKWKQAKLDAMPEADRKKALEAFTARWFPKPVAA